jgi:hypothetical protein
MTDKVRYFWHRWPRHLGLKPVSADIRTGLCSRARIPPGKSLGGQRLGGLFWRHLPISGGKDRAIPRLAAAKPRKVKDYSDGARKPELRRTAWWGWQDLNLPPPDYGW